MNFGGRNIGNSSQSVKGKERRAPLNNISARKNQMEFEQNDYNVKSVLGNSQNSDFNNNTNTNNLLGMKQNIFGVVNKNSTPQNDKEKIESALKDAIEENLILRDRVTELEALYAAAEDEIEKRDQCILELVEQLQKQSEEDTISQKQSKNGRKRVNSQ